MLIDDIAEQEGSIDAKRTIMNTNLPREHAKWRGVSPELLNADEG